MFKKIDDSSVTIIRGCSCKCNNACDDKSTQGTKLNGKAKK